MAAGRPSGVASTSTSRNAWAQLGFCRESNIHFCRRLTIEPPESIALASEPQRRKDSFGALVASEPSVRAQRSKQRTKQQRTSANLDNLDNIDAQIDEKLGNLKISAGEQPATMSHGNALTAAQQRRKTSSAAAAGAVGAAATSGQQLATIDMSLVREKLIKKVEKHPFWSSKAAKRMQLTRVDERRVYVYKLVSYCERRELEWRFEPYRGGLVAAIPYRKVSDAAAAATATTAGEEPALSPSRVEPVSAIERQVPPADYLWSLDAPAGAQPSELFVGQMHTREVPNSAFVKRCHGCAGRGRIKCRSCHGVGYEVCLSCSGKGTTRGGAHSAAAACASGGSSSRRHQLDSVDSSDASGRRSALGERDSHQYGEPGGVCASSGSVSGGGGGGSSASAASAGWLAESCHFCHGAGQKRCWVCAGRAYTPCQACAGACQLRCYLGLTYTWLNHRDEAVLNNDDAIIPRERLRLAQGELLLDEQARSLEPLGRARLLACTPDAAATATATATTDIHSNLISTADATAPPPPNKSHAHVAEPEAQLVCAASKRLIDKHAQAYAKQERMLQQRHTVQRVTCHLVHYEWKQRRGHFVVYGNDRKLYIAKYPFKSICNIT